MDDYWNMDETETSQIRGQDSHDTTKLLKSGEKVGSSDASTNTLQDQVKNVQGKRVAILMFPRQNTHASLMPTNLRESVWKELHKDHGDHLVGRRIHSLSHYNLVHKFIPMLKAMKIPSAKAAVDKE